MGWTPLHYASCSDNSEIIMLLLKNGADVNAKTSLNQTALHIACGKNKVSNIKALLSSTTITANTVDSNGFTPFLKGCASQSYEAAMCLADNLDTIDVNHSDKVGNTALHYTMEDNNYNMSIYLLKKGARVDLKNNEGKICLDLIEDKNIKSILLSYINN